MPYPTLNLAIRLVVIISILWSSLPVSLVLAGRPQPQPSYSVASTGAIASAQASCAPPASGDWVVTQSCTFNDTKAAPGDVLVQNNAVLTIAAGAILYIDFQNHKLLVANGSGVLIQQGGRIAATGASGETSISGLSATNDSPTDLGQSTTLTATITAGTNVGYEWDFGDGTGGSGAVITHTYASPGLYTAVVTASNPISVLTATTTVSVTGASDLAISKSGPATANSGEPITYTLTISNNGTAVATDLVITDTLPAGAYYVSGGQENGGVVSWTLSSLAAGSSATAQLVVTATQTVTNSDYRVSASGGVAATGQQAVVTVINPPAGVVANFSAAPVTGAVPLTVTFSNSSLNASSYL